jgi:hypothetical protein
MAQTQGAGDAQQLECIVAAILTAASIGASGNSPEIAVKRYAEILQRLRAAGGPVHPNP